MLATQKELAKILNISTRWVQQLQKDGILYKDGDSNNYRLEDCVPAFIDYKVSSETGRKAAITKEQMQAEHEKVKMDISKLKLRRLRRDSLDAQAVEASWSDMLIYFSGKLDALAPKIIMAIAGEDMNTQIETADKIIKDLKRELYEYDPKDIDENLDVDDFDDEDDEEGDE